MNGTYNPQNDMVYRLIMQSGAHHLAEDHIARMQRITAAQAKRDADAWEREALKRERRARAQVRLKSIKAAQQEAFNKRWDAQLASEYAWSIAKCPECKGRGYIMAEDGYSRADACGVCKGSQRRAELTPDQERAIRYWQTLPRGNWDAQPADIREITSAAYRECWPKEKYPGLYR